MELFDLVKFVADPAYTGDVEVRLITAPTGWGQEPHTVSQLTEANFPGYSRAKGNIWTIRRLDSPNAPYLQSNLLNWIRSETGDAVVVTGAAIVGKLGEAETLLDVKFLGTPRPFVFAGRGLAAKITLQGFRASLTGA